MRLNANFVNPVEKTLFYKLRQLFAFQQIFCKKYVVKKNYIV
jgi:hypothetical protein